MKALFYDTETTGLPLFKEPSEDPRQPHLVQLAATLVDLDTRKTIASLDVICRPSGWTIPEEIAVIHGITTERARDVGVSESLAVELFLELWTNCAVRVAHNEPFDARIVRIALKRHNGKIGRDPDQWKAAPAECTQRLATPILKLPPTAKMLAAGFNKHKSANLAEAYKFFTGTDLQDAHSALADVQACMAVYFAIKGAPY
ncbi:MAG: 3'-5' exonuclease [Pseudomonadota bacterium]